LYRLARLPASNSLKNKYCSQALRATSENGAEAAPSMEIVD